MRKYELVVVGRFGFRGTRAGVNHLIIAKMKNENRKNYLKLIKKNKSFSGNYEIFH